MQTLSFEIARKLNAVIINDMLIIKQYKIKKNKYVLSRTIEIGLKKFDSLECFLKELGFNFEMGNLKDYFLDCLKELLFTTISDLIQDTDLFELNESIKFIVDKKVWLYQNFIINIKERGNIYFTVNEVKYKIPFNYHTFFKSYNNSRMFLIDFIESCKLFGIFISDNDRINIKSLKLHCNVVSLDAEDFYVTQY
jgi:hypothetical protein